MNVPLTVEIHIYSPHTTKLIIITPSEPRSDDPSVSPTAERDSRLFLFSPESEAFPLDIEIREHTSQEGSLVCYYEDVDLFKLNVGDV